MDYIVNTLKEDVVNKIIIKIKFGIKKVTIASK